MLIGYIQFRFEDDSKYFAKSTVMPKYSFHICHCSLIGLKLDLSDSVLISDFYKILCAFNSLYKKSVNMANFATWGPMTNAKSTGVKEPVIQLLEKGECLCTPSFMERNVNSLDVTKSTGEKVCKMVNHFKNSYIGAQTDCNKLLAKMAEITSLLCNLLRQGTLFALLQLYLISSIS